MRADEGRPIGHDRHGSPRTRHATPQARGRAARRASRARATRCRRRPRNGAGCAAALVRLRAPAAGCAGLFWSIGAGRRRRRRRRRRRCGGGSRSGPIELDLATPWLKAAIEENFGSKHTRRRSAAPRSSATRTAAPSLRMRDIVVRDADGTVVASAPKAEVGISGIGLLTRQAARRKPQSGRRRNVGAHRDGRPVTVFAGADKRPIATAPPRPCRRPRRRPRPAAKPALPPGALRAGFEDVAGVLAWIDGARRDRPRRPRSARARPQERQSDRRRPAQRQALDLQPASTSA